MSYKEYYLEGKGNRNDAIFRSLEDGTIFVLAEVGFTGCICDKLTKMEARTVFKRLKRQGWRPVKKSRTNYNDLWKKIYKTQGCAFWRKTGRNWKC